MKSVLAIIISICIFSSCASQKFTSISKQIEKKCIGNSRWKGKSFHELRLMLSKNGKLDFIASDSDTLYILESYSVEDGVYTGKIWNRLGNLNYSYNRAEFKYNESKAFTNYTVQLLESWDTAAIRREESLNAKSVPEKYITGIRVIKSQKPVAINCIKFKEFFNLERDR